MRPHAILLACTILVACHRPTEVRGMYINGDSSGTLFPCDDPKVAIIVVDSTLAKAGSKPVLVRLRGVRGHSGSIYGGAYLFQVQQILEVRPRGAGECSRVAEPIAPLLPDR